MESSQAVKLPQNNQPQHHHQQQHPLMKYEKHFYASQIFLRILAVAASVAAASLMLTSKQHVVVYGTPFDAHYYYSSAFKFFGFANIIASAFCLLSLVYLLSAPANYFFLFLHDLVMMSLVLAGCTATTTVGYIGEYGYGHIGWLAICDQFGKFCNKVTWAAVVSYLSFVSLLVLTIISASKSRSPPTHV